MSFNQSLNKATPTLLAKIMYRFRKRSAHHAFQRVRKIPQKRLEEVLPQTRDVIAKIQSESGLNAQLGNIDARELIMISAICAWLKPKLVFEFGTFDGRTTLHLAINSPDDAKVMTIDLDPEDPIRKSITDDTFYTKHVRIGQHFEGSAVASRIQQLYGNTLEYDHSALNGKVDLVFVDAGHDFDLVKSDGTKAIEMVRAGGIVLWHDYSFGHPGVYTYLNDLAGSHALVNLEHTSLVCFIKSDSKSGAH